MARRDQGHRRDRIAMGGYNLEGGPTGTGLKDPGGLCWTPSQILSSFSYHVVSLYIYEL